MKKSIVSKLINFIKTTEKSKAWQGHRLTDLRNSANLTQKELAQQVAIPEAALRAYEAGRVPALDTIVRFADHFNVSADYFVGKMTDAEEKLVLVKKKQETMEKLLLEELGTEGYDIFMKIRKQNEVVVSEEEPAELPIAEQPDEEVRREEQEVAKATLETLLHEEDMARSERGLWDDLEDTLEPEESVEPVSAENNEDALEKSVVEEKELTPEETPEPEEIITVELVHDEVEETTSHPDESAADKNSHEDTSLSRFLIDEKLGGNIRYALSVYFAEAKIENPTVMDVEELISSGKALSVKGIGASSASKIRRALKHFMNPETQAPGSTADNDIAEESNADNSVSVGKQVSIEDIVHAEMEPKEAEKQAVNGISTEAAPETVRKAEQPRPVHQLGLPLHTTEILYRRFDLKGIYTPTIEDLADLYKSGELASIQQLGKVSLERIEEVLRMSGYLDDEESNDAGFPANPVKQPEDVDLDTLKLSSRAYNCLHRAGARTTEDAYNLFRSGEMKTLRNLGSKTYGEITEKLEKCGYVL